MSDSITAVVVLDSGVSSTDVARALPGGSGIEIAAMIDGLDEARMRLVETNADLVVVFARSQSESVLDLIEYAVLSMPGRPVVVLGYGVGSGFTKRAFAAGADDLIELPAQAEQVAFALQKAMARRVGGGDVAGGDRTPLICVLGPKGGTGKTLVSTSLAVALAQAGKRVVVVDLDLQFGDVGLTMAMAPEKTIYDLVKSGGSLDAEKLDDFLAVHQSGVKLLLAPCRPDHAAVVTVEVMREIFSVLRQMVDFVIVDTPPGFTPEVIATIDAATSVVMVTMLDALSLKNTKLGLETLDLMGFPSKHVKLVLNRARSRVGITEGEVVHVVGRVPDVMIPSDRDITRAINEGTPIVITKPQSEATQAFRALARSYLGDAAARPVQAKRKSLFARRVDDDLFADPTPTPKRQSLSARGGEPADSALTPAVATKRRSIFARGSNDAAPAVPAAPPASAQSIIAANGNGNEPSPTAGEFIPNPPSATVGDTDGQPTPVGADHVEVPSPVAEVPDAPIEGTTSPRRKRKSLVAKAFGARAETSSASRSERESLLLQYVGNGAIDEDAAAAVETVATPDAVAGAPFATVEPVEVDTRYPDVSPADALLSESESVRLELAVEVQPVGAVGLDEPEPVRPELAVEVQPDGAVGLDEHEHELELATRAPRAIDMDDPSHRYASVDSPAWLVPEQPVTVAFDTAATGGMGSAASSVPPQQESVWPRSNGLPYAHGENAPPAAPPAPVSGTDAVVDRWTAARMIPAAGAEEPSYRRPADNGYGAYPQRVVDPSPAWASTEEAPEAVTDDRRPDAAPSEGDALEWWTMFGDLPEADAGAVAPEAEFEHSGGDDSTDGEYTPERDASLRSWER